MAATVKTRQQLQRGDLVDLAASRALPANVNANAATAGCYGLALFWRGGYKTLPGYGHNDGPVSTWIGKMFRCANVEACRNLKVREVSTTDELPNLVQYIVLT